MDVRAERFTLAALLEDIQATFRAADRGEGPRLRGLGRRVGPVRAGHRPAAAAPGARQPAVQRGQVHRAGPGDAAGRRRDGAADGPFAAFFVTDTGIGIAPENLDDDLRRVPAGRRDAEPPLRRHRARAVDRQRGQRAARRQDQRHQRPGPRQHVHPVGARHAAGRAGDRPGARARLRPAGRGRPRLPGQPGRLGRVDQLVQRDERERGYPDPAGPAPAIDRRTR